MKWAVAIVVLSIVLPMSYASSTTELSALCSSGFYSCDIYNYTYEHDGCSAFSGTQFSTNPYNSRYEGYSDWSIYRLTYFSGYPSISYNCSGIATVYYDSFPDNDDVLGWPDCNRYGCFGEILPSSGILVVAYPGETMRNVWLQCWDGSQTNCTLDNGEEVSSYSWSWQGFNVNASMNVTYCSNDADCGKGMVCDTSGSWQEWSCVSVESYLPSREVIMFDVPVTIYYTYSSGYVSGSNTTENYVKSDIVSIVIDFVGTALSSFVSVISLLYIGIVAFCIYYIIRNLL